MDDTAGTTTVDETTPDAAGPAQPRQRVALTLLYHPSIERIGQRILFPSSAPGASLTVSRQHPELVVPAGEPCGPLADPRISRTGLRLTLTASELVLAPESSRLQYRLDGRPGTARESLALSSLHRGVILELSRGAILLVHWVEDRAAPPDDHGIIGHSDALHGVRDALSRIAGLRIPVLITGESGVGKEVVARAIHLASPRAHRSWIAINMAALTPSTATAELFGHAQGAFTGASRASDGYFGAADGGTLFLDEIGQTPPEVQPRLLRALETGEIQPVGMAPRRVDVRLITATDADLDRLTGAGTFGLPLLQRIRMTVLPVPPLRQRREDIPVLFAHFLRQQLCELGAEHLLAAPPPDARPWLSRKLVLQLLRYPWPGNVRELKAVAVQVAVHGHTESRARLPESLTTWLERDSTLPGADEPATPAGRDVPAVRVRPSLLDDAQVLAALQHNHWRIRATAEVLGISRNSLYTLMKRAGCQRAGELTREDILAAARAAGSRDPGRLAELLRVSPRGLTLRMRSLGLGPGR
jgi:two-component system nitrogen regulation response regulator GlnG